MNALRAVCVMAVLLICAIPGGAATRSAPGCDRACLEGFVDRFLQALAARDPTRVAWSKGAIFTENNVRLEIGDGLWGTADGLGSARQGLKLTDPASGEAGYFGIVMERGEPIYLAVRLKVVDNRVAEAEILANRKSETGARGNPELLEHDPSFLEALPEAQRLSRQRLIELANGYFSTLERNDGRLFTDFDAACQRRENGVLTASDPQSSDPLRRMDCGAQLKMGFFRFDDRVRERDFPLVDEQRGIVFARGFIDHAGRLDRYPLADGTIRESRVKAPHSWHFLEAFKIEGGRIRRVESMFIYVPYGMPSPWTRAGSGSSRPVRTSAHSPQERDRFPAQAPVADR